MGCIVGSNVGSDVYSPKKVGGWDGESVGSLVG